MNNYKIKQVIIVRKDLNMRKGKMCAQVAHASMKFLTKNYKTGELLISEIDEMAQEWLKGSFAKIVVGVNSEEELKEVFNDALKEGIRAEEIIDSGFTEFNGVPTLTCICLGPDYCEKLDKITGHLKLL